MSPIDTVPDCTDPVALRPNLRPLPKGLPTSTRTADQLDPEGSHTKFCNPCSFVHSPSTLPTTTDLDLQFLGATCQNRQGVKKDSILYGLKR
jgi:hypothetical protein